MPHVACPHCSQPIENDPSLAGSAATCPHCESDFQFPDARTASEKRVATATASRRSPRSKTKATATPKTKAPASPKSDGKKKPSEKSKSAGKEKPAGVNLKLLAPRIAIAAVVIFASLYFFTGRKRDYSAERQSVLTYIGNNMPKAKFDSWHGEGMAKGCTTTNGVKIPGNGVVIRAHVTTNGKLKYKKDIVFIVVNGRVTDEIEPQNFRLPSGSGK